MASNSFERHAESNFEAAAPQSSKRAIFLNSRDPRLIDLLDRDLGLANDVETRVDSSEGAFAKNHALPLGISFVFVLQEEGVS